MNDDKYTYNFLYPIVEEVIDELDLETDKFTVDKQVREVIKDEEIYKGLFNNIMDFIKDTNNIEG